MPSLDLTIQKNDQQSFIDSRKAPTMQPAHMMDDCSHSTLQPPVLEIVWLRLHMFPVGSTPWAPPPPPGK